MFDFSKRTSIECRSNPSIEKEGQVRSNSAKHLIGSLKLIASARCSFQPSSIGRIHRELGSQVLGPTYAYQVK